MPDVRFDPSNAVTFNLAEGRVLRDGSPPQVLVGADTLLAVAAAGGAQSIAGLGHAIGMEMGRRIAHRLDGGVRRLPVETVIEHLGGELAVTGLGLLHAERWGSAAVMVVDESPFGPAGDDLVEALLSAAISAATGRAAVAALLSREGGRARFFVGNRTAADAVHLWTGQGVPWGEVLVRLHGRDPLPEPPPRAPLPEIPGDDL